MEHRIQEYYERSGEFSPEYFDWKINHYRANRAIMKSFDAISLSGKNMLDIGCGNGFYAIPLASRCNQVTGFDPSEDAINAASFHAKRLCVNNVNFQVSTIDNFPALAQFDVAYAITVLMHIPNLKDALRKINGFIKLGGLFILSDLNRYHHTSLLFWSKQRVYIQKFSFYQLRSLLHESGFEVEKESGRIYSFLGKRSPEWVVNLFLENYAEKWPLKFLGEHIVMTCRKTRDI